MKRRTITAALVAALGASLAATAAPADAAVTSASIDGASATLNLDGADDNVTVSVYLTSSCRNQETCQSSNWMAGEPRAIVNVDGP